MNEALIAVISGLIILGGLVGTVLPLLPGVPFSLAGLILYAWFTNFQNVTVLGVIIFSILTAITILLDFFAPAMGAKSYKASKAGSIGSLLGAFFGIFFLGPIGIFLGPLIGGFLGEYLANPDKQHAMRAAWGAFVGMMIGTLFKLIVTISMFGYFLYIVIKTI